MSNDWMPSSREDKLTMARSWLSSMKCGAGKRWGMSEEFIQIFENLVTRADNEFFRAKKDRTVGTNVLFEKRKLKRMLVVFLT